MLMHVGLLMRVFLSCSCYGTLPFYFYKLVIISLLVGYRICLKKIRGQKQTKFMMKVKCFGNMMIYIGSYFIDEINQTTIAKLYG